MKICEFIDVVINSHMFIYTDWLYSHKASSVHSHGLFKNSVKYQQDRKYMQNVTLRRVRATFAAVSNNE
jgi:hypothetical protein